MQLNRKKHRVEKFDIVVIAIFLVSIIGILFYGRNHLALALVLALISVWMLLILAGRLAATFYFEGRMVRFLIAKNGSMPFKDFKSFFKEYQNFEDRINRLIERNIIDIVNESVVLKRENTGKGFQNKFMMWTTRKVRFRV